MKQPLLEWFKFLSKEKRNFLDQNISKIINYPDVVPSENSTSEILDVLTTSYLKDFIIKNKVDKILKMYKIKEYLGSGAMGIVFTLDEPHENYVLKVEIHYTPGPSAHKAKRPGVDYPQQVYAKQQKGKYEKGQVNVLESVALKNSEINTTNGKENIDFYLFVLTKVPQTTYRGKMPYKRPPGAEPYEGGMTSRQAVMEFHNTGIWKFFDIIIQNRPGTLDEILVLLSDNLHGSIFGKKLSPKARHNVAKIIQEKINNKDPDGLSKLIYSIFNKYFEFLSKKQFLDLCEDYYNKTIEAKEIDKDWIDYHGGNIGWFSDVPHAFDI